MRNHPLNRTLKFPLLFSLSLKKLNLKWLCWKILKLKCLRLGSPCNILSTCPDSHCQQRGLMAQQACNSQLANTGILVHSGPETQRSNYPVPEKVCPTAQLSSITPQSNEEMFWLSTEWSSRLLHTRFQVWQQWALPWWLSNKGTETVWRWAFKWRKDACTGQGVTCDTARSQQCAYCGQNGEGVIFRKKKVLYCSRPCQVDNWSKHKKECDPPSCMTMKTIPKRDCFIQVQMQGHVTGFRNTQVGLR